MSGKSVITLQSGTGKVYSKLIAARLHGLRSYKKVLNDAALHKDQA